MCARWPAEPRTYVRFFHFGRGSRLRKPTAFERAGCCLVPMAKQNRTPRRRDGAADRLIVVARYCAKTAPRDAVEHLESCEFCEHRSPPVRYRGGVVNVRVSDPLDAIAYPDAATLATIGGVIFLRSGVPRHFGRVAILYPLSYI